MFGTKNRQRIAWLSIGVLVGLVVGGIWPQSPAHAVATAQQESFAICTAGVDDNEAVFCLDSLTGELKGALINPQTHKFAIQFQTNVAADMKIDATKGAKYLVVSGGVSFRRAAGGLQFGNSVIYVAELNSGIVAAYGIPTVNTSRPATGAMPLVGLDMWKFRDIAIRQ